MLIFILCFISCQAQKNNIERDIVEVKEIHLTQKFQELIIRSAKHYKKNFSEDPRLIMVFLNYNGGINPTVNFMNMGIFLNHKQGGGFSSSKRFVGAVKIGEIVVLIHKSVYDVYNELFTISDQLKKIEIINDGNMNLCVQSYKLGDKNNSLIEEYCGDD